MSQVSDQNKALTVRFFEQVFNHQNYDVVGTILSPDYQYNGRATTAKDTIAWAQGLQKKFPGLQFVIETILAEDEKVALRWRMNATDAATGTKGYVTGTNI